MPGEMIACCGLNCAECEAFMATQKNDMAALSTLAEKWSQMFGAALAAEECVCDGCKADGRKIGYCAECKVRACAVGRGVANCAYCEDYECDTLTAFLGEAGKARDNLEAIRRTL
jgi:hypothetical protein